MKTLPIQSQAFETLYQEFKQLMQTKGYAKGQNSMYPSCIREFLFFIEQQGVTSIKQIRGVDVISYHEYIKQRPNQRREGGLSSSMIRHHMFSLRLFFDYLLDTDQIEASPAKLPKFQRSNYEERNVLSLEEIKELYTVCENAKDNLILSIAYGCGLRRSEIQNLNTNDVHFYKGMLQVRKGKFGKSRSVPMSDKVVTDLKEYLIYERTKFFQKSNTTCTTNSFIINRQGKRMRGDAINKRLKVLINKTKNETIKGKHITLHCLRHSISTHLIDNGANMEFVQKLMGHSEIDTAHLYSKRRKQHLSIKNQIHR